MKTSEIKEQFEQVLCGLQGIEGLTTESQVQIAQVILQESGKDRRTELLREARSSNNGAGSNNRNLPATDRQKNALMRFGIEYSDDITKSEAYELLEKAFEQLNNQQR